MKKLLLIPVLILASCQHESIQERSGGNPDGLKVELVYHLDITYTPGVYRFFDNGHTHYFVIGPNNQVSCSATHKSGKSVTIEDIDTK